MITTNITTIQKRYTPNYDVNNKLPVPLFFCCIDARSSIPNSVWDLLKETLVSFIQINDSQGYTLKLWVANGYFVYVNFAWIAARNLWQISLSQCRKKIKIAIVMNLVFFYILLKTILIPKQLISGDCGWKPCYDLLF